MGYGKPRKNKEMQKIDEPEKKRPIISMAERAAQFRAMLAADDRVNQAMIARKLGLPRTWVSKVLSVP